MGTLSSFVWQAAQSSPVAGVMGSAAPSPHRVPMIDFSGLDPASPGASRGWSAAREQVMQAMESFGCFEAVCDEMTPEIREAVFGEVMREVFGLPKEVKLRNSSDKPFVGYLGGIPGMEYESLSIDDPMLPKGVEKFAALMWPQGNPSFCAATLSFSKILSKLDQIVRRMMLEGLGVEKYFDSFMESSISSLRISEYRAPSSQDMNISLPTHTDQSMTSIVCQHQVEGLEILTKDGEWIKPSQNSITFMTGDTFLAWSNGRFEPATHRVTFSGGGTRYSAIFGSHPKAGHTVQAPEELVDDKHPLRYKPFDYYDYLQFRFSQAGKETKCTLDAYCGA